MDIIGFQCGDIFSSIKGIDTILGRVRRALAQRIEKDLFGDLFAREEERN